MELPDSDSNPPTAHDSIPTAQEAPQATTPALEPASKETPTTDESPQEAVPRLVESEPAPMPTMDEDVWPELAPEPTLQA